MDRRNFIKAAGAVAAAATGPAYVSSAAAQGGPIRIGLLAPLTGVVSLRVSRQGEVVEAGSPVLTIIDTKDTWVRASVEERESAAVRLGDEVNVALSSGETIRGRVTQVSAVAEFATRRDVSRGQRDVRSIGFKIALPPDPRVHPGMTAYVILPRSR